MYALLCPLGIGMISWFFFPSDYSSSYKRNSPQHEGNSVDKIIDGQDETCSLPLKKSSIDLIQSINVTYIQVKNSQQHPTSIRIYVRKFRYGTGHACGRDHIIGSGERRIISCMSLFGQSVKIVPGRRTKSFSLCELQVFNDSGILMCIFINIFVLLTHPLYR